MSARKNVCGGKIITKIGQKKSPHWARQEISDAELRGNGMRWVGLQNNRATFTSHGELSVAREFLDEVAESTMVFSYFYFRQVIGFTITIHRNGNLVPEAGDPYHGERNVLRINHDDCAARRFRCCFFNRRVDTEKLVQSHSFVDRVNVFEFDKDGVRVEEVHSIPFCPYFQA